MALLDLWKDAPEQLRQKQVHQLIAFAGGGKLLDESPCSTEFRAFLASVSSKHLADYAEQCLAASFDGSGFALQDIVNEIGSRLGAAAKPGRYRGTTKHTGFDGLWRFPNGHDIVVEVKTTDAYSINLDTIAGYRRDLIAQSAVSEDRSSILLIVGRQETGNLEAQIRGSRFAWDIRVISVDALVRLMFIKQEVEDPVLVRVSPSPKRLPRTTFKGLCRFRVRKRRTRHSDSFCRVQAVAHGVLDNNEGEQDLLARVDIPER